jgi:hypothetical protein
MKGNPCQEITMVRKMLIIFYRKQTTQNFFALKSLWAFRKLSMMQRDAFLGGGTTPDDLDRYQEIREARDNIRLCQMLLSKL